MAFPPAGTSVPTLALWQASYLGVTLGGATNFGVKKYEGVDMPPVRTGDSGRPRDYGEFIGLDLLGGREVVLTFDIGANGGGSSAFNTAWSQIATATVPTGTTEQPLFINLPNYGTVACMARPRKRNIPIDYTFTQNLAENAVVEFHATDPRWYSQPTLDPSVGLPTPGVGFTFNITFNLSFGGGTTANTLTLANNGNIDCRPILTITGPCTYPSIQNQSITGTPTLQFGVTMASGDQLVIDTDLHTATYYASGSSLGASRLNTIQAGSSWWSLAPGSNVIAFDSQDTTSVAGTLAVAYASAFII